MSNKVAGEKKFNSVIVWMRRALRVNDNTALFEALADSREVFPFLCLSDDARYAKDTPRAISIRHSISALEKDLRDHGSRLCLRKGHLDEELVSFASSIKADAVYAVSVYDPVALKRDELIKQTLLRAGIVFVTFKDRVMVEKEELLNQSGQPFKVFTPYKRTWLQRSAQVAPLLPALKIISTPSEIPHAFALSRFKQFSVDAKSPITSAHELLDDFIQHRIGKYKEQRDLPGVEGTSRLSAALSVGAISIRQVYYAALEARAQSHHKSRESIDTFISELIWREFYYQILANYPHVVRRAFRDEFANISWRENEKHWSAWCNGQTGFPIVDAGMRQLVQEGWMHNRVRMIAASFLTKDLHINWQRGEEFFFDQLCDADIASNNGGWQWTAGTGTDASPWFRIFNPVAQGEKFDPDGHYVRKYVPELRNVPEKYIHSPWTMDRQQQLASGALIGRDYPKPIVDHAEEREVTMAMYKQDVSNGDKRKKGQLNLEL